MRKGLLCHVAVGVLLAMEEKLLCVVAVGVLSGLLPGSGVLCVVAVVVYHHALVHSSLQRMMLSCTLMLWRWCKSSSIDSSSCDMCYTRRIRSMCIFLLKKMLEGDDKKALLSISILGSSSANVKKEMMALMREHLGNQNC